MANGRLVARRFHIRPGKRHPLAIAVPLAAMLLSLITSSGSAETPASRSATKSNALSSLTLDSIFASEDWDSVEVDLKWDAQEDQLWKIQSARESDAATARPPALIRLDPPSLDETMVLQGDEWEPAGRDRPLEIAEIAWSTDRRYLLARTDATRVWRDNTRGDAWLLDRRSGTWRQLGQPFPARSLMFPTLSPDNASVAYVVAQETSTGLYRERLDTGQTTPIAVDDDPRLIQGTFDWVYEEELGLQQGFHFSPDGTKIAFWRVDTREVPQQTLIDRTSERYSTVKAFAYPKVGQKNSAVAIGIHHLDSGKTVWAQIDGDPREHYLAAMGWPDASLPGASEHLMVQQLNRLQNVNRLLGIDAATGQCRQWLRETSHGWVTPQSKLFWLPRSTPAAPTDAAELLWLSERSGFRQLYRVDLPSGFQPSDPTASPLVTPLTREPFDVTSLDAVDPQSGTIFFSAAIDHPSRRASYRIDRDGDNFQRLSPAGGGTFAMQFSPSCDWAVETHSDATTPPVQRLVRIVPYERVGTIADNSALTEQLNNLRLGSREFFRVDVDGVPLDAYLMLPPGVDDESSPHSVPLVVYVYGEPAGQTVVDRWGGKNELWHRYLTQLGFAVMSVDNRGVDSPRGREFRQSIHGQIGILPPADQAAAVRQVLQENPFLDPERVASWGWSGGGSTTLHAIFRYPDLYAAAIAVAPVPDQLDYDTIYQERYMGDLEANRDAYEQGSPITHVAGLADPLLIIHGTGDDNVHYASTERLINRLVAEGKSFTMMAYPGRTHAITEGKGTSLHLRQLMTDFLIHHLAPGRNHSTQIDR